MLLLLLCSCNEQLTPLLVMRSIKVCLSHTERYISCPPFKQRPSFTSFLGATASTENRECRASWEGALHPSQDTTRAVLEQTRTLVGSTSPGCCLVLKPHYSTRPIRFDWEGLEKYRTGTRQSWLHLQRLFYVVLTVQEAHFTILPAALQHVVGGMQAGVTFRPQKSVPASWYHLWNLRPRRVQLTNSLRYKVNEIYEITWTLTEHFSLAWNVSIRRG